MKILENLGDCHAGIFCMLRVQLCMKNNKF